MGARWRLVMLVFGVLCEDSEFANLRSVWPGWWISSYRSVRGSTENVVLVTILCRSCRFWLPALGAASAWIQQTRGHTDDPFSSQMDPQNSPPGMCLFDRLQNGGLWCIDTRQMTKYWFTGGFIWKASCRMRLANACCMGWRVAISLVKQIDEEDLR